jgi:hypothetical protein
MSLNILTYLLHKVNILFLILATWSLNSYHYNIHINFNLNFNNVILIWSDRWVWKVNRATKFVWTNFTSSWIKKSGSALTVPGVVGRRNKTKLAYNFVILSWVVCALMNMPHGRHLPGIRNVTQSLLTRRNRELLLPLCCFTTKCWQLKQLAEHRALEIKGTFSKLKVFCRVQADAPTKSSTECHIFFYYYNTSYQWSKLVTWSEMFRTLIVNSQGSSAIRRANLIDVKYLRGVLWW